MLSAPTFRPETSTRQRALSAEGLAYVALCALALAVRVLVMAGGPLTPGEAEQALAAYRLAQGSPISAVAPLSPALLSLQALAFSLFAANDAWVRLPVVLLTSLFPLAFHLLRPMLGRRASLLAALLLCFSPVWTALGAQGVAGGLAAVALLFAFACGRQAAWLGANERAVSPKSRRYAAASGAALALALSASPDAWAGLALAVVIWLIVWGTRRRETGVRSQESVEDTRTSPGSWLLTPGSFPWRPFAVSLALTLLLLATAATFNLSGLQGVLDLPVTWARSYFVREPGVLVSQALLLLGYETLLVGLGLGTFALAAPSTRWRRALYVWTIGSLLLALASGVRLGSVPLALPALAVLAAEAVLLVLRWLSEAEGRTRLQGAVISAALIGYGYISIAGFAKRGQVAFLVLAITALGIAVALVSLVWARRGPRLAAGMAGLSLLMLLVPWAVSNTIQSAWYQRHNPAELLYSRVTMPSLEDLRQDVERLSWTRARHRTDLPLVVENGVSPVVAWYLRDWRYAQWVDAVPSDTGAEVLLTAGTEPPRLESPYVGQDYALEGYWWPYFPGPREFLSWLFYREGLAAAHERVTLWVRDTAAETQSAITLGP